MLPLTSVDSQQQLKSVVLPPELLFSFFILVARDILTRCRIVYILIAKDLLACNLRNENIIPSRVWNID